MVNLWGANTCGAHQLKKRLRNKCIPRLIVIYGAGKAACALHQHNFKRTLVGLAPGHSTRIPRQQDIHTSKKEAAEVKPSGRCRRRGLSRTSPAQTNCLPTLLQERCPASCFQDRLAISENRSALTLWQLIADSETANIGMEEDQSCASPSHSVQNASRIMKLLYPLPAHTDDAGRGAAWRPGPQFELTFLTGLGPGGCAHRAAAASFTQCTQGVVFGEEESARELRILQREGLRTWAGG